LTLITGDYILKPPSQKYTQIPENEDLTMHLAEIVGIKTVAHALVPLASGELAYITRRIDRDKKGKVHMEDLCQLSGILTENKYLSTLERMSKVVAEYSSAPGFDLVKLFELTLFCYITGNNDMHLKNFSLIDQGGWQLSPAYDLLNVHLINPIDKEESALSINGRKKNLKKSDFHFLGLSFKLSETQMANAFEMITSSKERMIEFINKSFLLEETKHFYSSLLEKRIQILS
jgi:serine/threonine-protein kinase HipA